MIGFLILFLVLIIFLAIFIGNNLSYLGTFWFFHTYTDVPILVLVFFSFAAGMIFSILLFIIGKILKMKKETEEIETEKVEAENIKNKIRLGRKNKAPVVNTEDKNSITSDTDKNSDNSDNE